MGSANISNNIDCVVGNIHKYPKPNVQFVFHVYPDRADIKSVTSMKSASLTSHCIFCFMDVGKCISRFCDCRVGSIGCVAV